jgi:hypothetical protein
MISYPVFVVCVSAKAERRSRDADDDRQTGVLVDKFGFRV